MKMSTKARVVLAPLGVPVSEDGKKNMSTWEAARESFKKDPKTFPDTIGFEAWCSLMSFDVGKVDGGSDFQALMAFLLSDSSSPTLGTLEEAIKKKQHFTEAYYDASIGWPRNSTLKVQDVGAVDRNQNKAYYVSETARSTTLKFRSATLGNRSNNTTSIFEYHGKPQDGANSNRIEINVSHDIYSQVSFLLASGVTPTNAGGEGVHSSAMSFLTDGTSSTNKANMGEQFGKLAVGNLCAQLFGLYWYKGCNDKVNNWSVNGIRTRMFNPSYSGPSYRMLLKLSTTVSADQRNGGGAYMGGDSGISLPKVKQYETNVRNLLFIKNKFRLVGWMCGCDSQSKVQGSRATTTSKHPMGSGVDLDYYIPRSLIGGSSTRSSTMFEAFGMLVYHPRDDTDGSRTDLDFGFQMVLHRNSPLNQTTTLDDISQPKPAYISYPKWRGMPPDIQKDVKKARVWVRAQLQKWTKTLLTEKKLTTESLFTFEDGKDVEYDAPASPVNVDVVMDDDQTDTDKGTNALTEEVEIVTNSEYLDGVEGARDQRVGESANAHKEIEIAIASKEDLEDYNGEKHTKLSVRPGAQTTYPGSNSHFHPKSNPFSRDKLYTEARFAVTTRAMSDAEEEEHAKLYGRANMTMRPDVIDRTGKPLKVIGVQNTVGRPRTDVLNKKINAFPREFVRVLGIFFNQQDIKHISNDRTTLLTDEQKRNGMQLGVWRIKQGGKFTTIYRHRAGAEEIFGPVFKFGVATSPAQKQKIAAIFKWDSVSGFETQDDTEDFTEHLRVIREFRITSNMTVGQYVNTPWHIAYLPISMEQMHLQHYESFSMGCRRCARAFYEYKEMHASYSDTPVEYRQYPTRFWKRAGSKAHEAAQPFHEDYFWTRNTARNDTHNPARIARVRAEDVGNRSSLPRDVPGGHQNWEVELFDISKTDNTRAHNKAELRYKAHSNHLYEYAKNASIVQGRPNTRSKVALYDTGFKLRRVSAYSNVCMDCAADMDRLGLLQRSWKGTRRVAGSVATNEQMQKEMQFGMSMRRGPITDSNRDEIQDVYDEMIENLITPFEGTKRTMFKSPAEIYVTKDLSFANKNSKTKQDDSKLIREALDALGVFLDNGRDKDKKKRIAQATKFAEALTSNPALFDILTDAYHKYTHENGAEYKRSASAFDSDIFRMEYRTPTELRIHNFEPSVKALSATQSATTAKKVEGSTYKKGKSQWKGDPWWKDKYETPQRRRMTQTRLFITWALHSPVTDPVAARLILEKMADATRVVFSDKYLSQMLRFGQKLYGMEAGARGNADSISKATWVDILKPRKADAVDSFYGSDKGNNTGSSYLYDTYETHVERVQVDAGMEIGPKRKHPHMHVLLTVDHWSYVQLDTWHMSSLFEEMFRGVGEWGTKFKLLDASGLPLYTDQEFPYMNVKLYPQDNWQEILANYVRKSANLTGIVARSGAGGARD